MMRTRRRSGIARASIAAVFLALALRTVEAQSSGLQQGADAVEAGQPLTTATEHEADLGADHEDEFAPAADGGQDVGEEWERAEVQDAAPPDAEAAPGGAGRHGQGPQLFLYEALGICLIVAWAVKYVMGRRENSEIAHSFIRKVHPLFCEQFAEAGPAAEEASMPADRNELLFRESCNHFLYYATGRRGCHGVLVRIDLAPRQDLFMVLWDLVNPATEMVTVEAVMNEEDMPPLIFALARKRQAGQVQRRTPDLHEHAGAAVAPGLPKELACLSESSDMVGPMLPPAVLKTLEKHADLVELVHFTDQNEAEVVGQKEVPEKLLRFQFRFPTDKSAAGMEGLGALTEMSLFYVDYLHRYKMPPAMRQRAEKKREEAHARRFRQTHEQRQERVQQLKSQRREKERSEYESLTAEQKRRRDAKDERKAIKAATNRRFKVKMGK